MKHETGIKCVAGFYFAINNKAFLVDWTKPYLVVAFALPDKVTPLLLKCFFKQRGKIAH